MPCACFFPSCLSSSVVPLISNLSAGIAQNRRRSEHPNLEIPSIATILQSTCNTLHQSQDGQDLRRASRTNLSRFFYLWGCPSKPIPSIHDISACVLGPVTLLTSSPRHTHSCHRLHLAHILAHRHHPHFSFHHAAETPSDVGLHIMNHNKHGTYPWPLLSSTTPRLFTLMHTSPLILCRVQAGGTSSTTGMAWESRAVQSGRVLSCECRPNLGSDEPPMAPLSAGMIV